MKRSTDCMSIANREQADLQVSGETMEMHKDGTGRGETAERHSIRCALPMGDWLMSLAIVRKALIWCTVINYGVLLVWFLFFLLDLLYVSA